MMGGMLGVGAVAVALRVGDVTNSTTVALAFLLVVLFVASLGDLAAAIVTSLSATLCFNFFFLPPLGTLTIADAHNWIALFAFLAVSIVASRLSASARARAQEALARRNELTRLFDLTRDILLTTELTDAVSAIARHVARRFELESVASCVAEGAAGRVQRGGTAPVHVAPADLDRALDANAGGPITLAPVRVGARVIALLATGGRPMEAGTRDAIAGIVAIALERNRFMEERRGAELAQQRAELASVLLASLSHDLRTP